MENISIRHVSLGVSSLLRFHVNVFLCACSDELDLNDVMDIELDFPVLADSQESLAPPATHSLSPEVCLIDFKLRFNPLRMQETQT